MVISNKNNLLKNQQHLKCSGQREVLLNNSLYKRAQYNCSSSGFSSTFDSKVLLNIDDEETFLNFPLYKTGLTERCDKNEYTVETNMKKNKYLFPQNQYNSTNGKYSYDLAREGDDYSETAPKDDELNNLYPLPQHVDLNKGNKIIIVNSACIKKRKTDRTSSQKEGELPPDVLPNKPVDQPEIMEKPVENKANIETDTFNVMNKEQKRDNDGNFPHHLHSSYITKEYRTTSFFDDFLESNPSFRSYMDSSAEHRRFGCSADCLRPKIADILKLPIKNEHDSHIQTRSFSEFDPRVFYMEPKCSPSCQGIPNKTHRYGVNKPELKPVPIYSPEYNFTDSCCTSNWDFYENSGLIDFDERYCKRNPVRTRRFQAATLYQKHPEFCCLNESDNQYRREPYCHNCKRPSVEKTKNTENNDDHLSQDQPSTKKKKQFACCNSGKVDEHEISSHPKRASDQKNFQQNESKNKKFNTRDVRNPCQEHYPPIHYINNDHFECDWDCPMVMQPEKEHRLLYMPSQKITKSVGCECDRTAAFPKCDDTMKDLGRNITIQIIPNCCQKNCSEHPNISTRMSPNAGEKNYYQETAHERKQIDIPTDLGCQNVTYVPYEPHKSKTVESRNQQPYPKYDSKNNSHKWWGCNWRRKKPQTPAYYRNQRNCIQTSDCCTTTGQDHNEVIADDCRLVEISNCQRVLPIRNDYVNRDRNLLKSLHRLNRGLLKDLFATPCPSTSSTCSKTCLQKMRGAPFPICAGTNPFCQAAKPFTTNQCCQYEPNCCHRESERTSHSTLDILAECLRYLKKGMLTEHHCDYPDAGCCCCQSFNCCCCQSLNCCCCQRLNNCCNSHQPRRCEIEEEIQPKTERKESKSCCTRCRSVEAKQSTRNCATVVSNHCFTRVETVCTNTEIRPKTPEINKTRKCYKRRCNCCCNNARTCCCCCEKFCCSEPSSCCHNIIRSSCNGEHFIYCCQCENKPILQCKILVPKETEQPSSKEVLVTNIKNTVSEEKGNTGTKEMENTGIKEIKSDISVDRSNSLQKTSNNIYSPVKYRPQRKDVLIKSITLDLCDLGEKNFSKFGCPSRRYPWMSNSFFVDLPNEMNRFVERGEFAHPLSEKVYDPTPCLKPEVIHIDELRKVELNEQNIGGVIDEQCEVKRCVAFFDNKHQTNCFNIKNNETHSFKSNIDNELKDVSEDQHLDTKGANTYDDELKVNKTVEDKQKITNGEAVHEQVALGTKNKNHQVNKQPKISQQIASRTCLSLSKKTSNSSKPSNIVNYIPKPFTTRTGLMSFIPSFRDTCSHTQVKNKTKPATKVDKNIKITKKSNNKIEESKKGELENEVKNSRFKNCVISKNTVELTENSIEVKSRKGMPESRDFDKRDIDDDESEKKEVHLESTKQNEEIKKPMVLKKCGEIMHEFYEKSLSQNDQTAKSTILVSKTNLSDMITTMKSKSLVYPSQIKEQTETNSQPKFSNDKTGLSHKNATEFCSEVFQGSYSQNNMHIPSNIVSQCDLISLN